MIRKLFTNGRIFSPLDQGTPLAGELQGRVIHFPRGAMCVCNGLIEVVGNEEEVLKNPVCRRIDLEVDCRGYCVIPGFVDCHTHMCFVKRREEEFVQRLEGADYLEILRRGGGILSSVRTVREAPDAELHAMTRRHARAALQLGTTTLEIKSGYGLETASELRMLRIIGQLGREMPQDVVATFLGAHALPWEFTGNPDDYVDLVVHEMIPAVAKEGLARFCDVFCERGVFDAGQSRRILESARSWGLGLKIHADELHDVGGAALAADLRVTSAEHLLRSSEANIRAMARAGVTGVLLPATAYSMRKEYAPARRMVELGLPIAIATDCNPGTGYTESMPFVFGLSVLNMGLSIREALVASTLNAAYAVGLGRKVGSLEVGKQADFLLLDGDSPAILAYHAGVSPVVEVYKQGEPVYSC
ncbi:MAG: imidazolonepropionase [Deltaproteobacteria bacterium]|nr:imidazolonepropionase [Deltaproteobacteria bacterium]